MPSKRQSSSNKRAQGGGRNPNSEPRLQVFRDFNGVNFELADDVDLTEYDADQTDLQMNYMFLQNNVATVSNKTMETRDDIVELFKAPGTTSFLGPTCLVGDTLYASRSMDAADDGAIAVAQLPDDDAPVTMDEWVELRNPAGSHHTWLSFEHYDDKLIGMTRENEIWTMDLNSSSPEMANALEVPNPTTDFTGNMTAMGSLVINSTMTDECPFRIEIAHTWVNKYGPTEVSPTTTFYANHPVSEWHAGCYLRLNGTLPGSGGEYGVIAIEFYYRTDNAMSLLFAGRKDVRPDQRAWSFDWYGYIDATNMWPIANLIAPTENYTKGVPASRVKAIDGRLYFWGDRDNPQRLYIGGNPGNLLSISPGTGGGFVDVEPGTNQAVRYVDKYKTQSGNSIVTMLCDSPNSRKEQRYNLVENTITLSNEQSMRSWQAEQVAGAVGCKSYYGAVVCADGLYSVSRYGLALTTMTMEYNAQIRTNYVSEQIKPVFTDNVDVEHVTHVNIGMMLKYASVLELDGIIYMAICASDPGDSYGPNDVLFCYDINLKAWWTYSIPDKILGLFHVDSEYHREGVGIVTPRSIYMLPTTQPDDHDSKPDHDFLIQTGEISTQMPQQGWQYLSQLEFHYDYLVGDVEFTVRMIDIFGREVVAKKTVSEDEYQHNYVVRMRIDQKVMSYVIEMRGTARFRLTHFLARVYVMSNKIGQVWGFDDSLSHRSSGRIHPTFKCYNDVRKAIFT